MSDRRIKLGLLVFTYDFGGLERCVARLVNHLDESRYEPIVFCMDRNGNAAKWITRDVEFVEIGKRPKNDFRAIWRLARELKHHKIDILHSHNWGTLVESTLACQIAKTPIHIHAQRGMDIPAPSAGRVKKGLRRKAFRWGLQRVDSIVAVAESVKDHLTKMTGLPENKISVIPNGIERQTAAPNARETIRNQLGIGHSSTVIGSVGRLMPVKDFGSLIRAFKQLLPDMDCHLVLVGAGGEATKLQTLVDSFGIADRVHFVGNQDNVSDWNSAFDLYVNCSLSEGMSQSILEAMAIGLPFVVTDVGDNRRVVGGEGSCGAVVPPNDPDRLAVAIRKMIRDEKRPTYAANARRRFEERYTEERMVQRYDQFYADLIDRFMADKKHLHASSECR